MKTIRVFLFAIILFGEGTTTANAGIGTRVIYSNSSLSLKAFYIPLLSGDTTYRVVPSAGHTYGYEIRANNRLLINQPTIPGMPGIKGFENKSDAEKVARLVIKKLQKGILPPIVTKKDLDSMKIKF